MVFINADNECYMVDDEYYVSLFRDGERKIEKRKRRTLINDIPVPNIVVEDTIYPIFNYNFNMNGRVVVRKKQEYINFESVIDSIVVFEGFKNNKSRRIKKIIEDEIGKTILIIKMCEETTEENVDKQFTYIKNFFEDLGSPIRVINTDDIEPNKIKRKKLSENTGYYELHRNLKRNVVTRTVIRDDYTGLKKYTILLPEELSENLTIVRKLFSLGISAVVKNKKSRKNLDLNTNLVMLDKIHTIEPFSELSFEDLRTAILNISNLRNNNTPNLDKSTFEYLFLKRLSIDNSKTKRKYRTNFSTHGGVITIYNEISDYNVVAKKIAYESRLVEKGFKSIMKRLNKSTAFRISENLNEYRQDKEIREYLTSLIAKEAELTFVDRNDCIGDQYYIDMLKKLFTKTA